MKNIKKEAKYDKKISSKCKIYQKSHFPERIWSIPNEKKKGHKI